MKYIIFDFDGTIVYTAKYIKNKLKKIGIKISKKDFKAHHDGNVFKKPKIPFTQNSIKEYGKYYKKDVKKIKLFFPKKEIIKLSEKYSLFIVSSNFDDAIKKFLKHNKIEYFKEVLGLDFHKSKVKKFEYLMNKYNFNSNQSIFITDTLGDIIEAQKVNIKSIAVNYGFHNKKRLKKGKPFKIASSFKEVLDIIKKENKS